ncbi:MAG: hypothetical protein ACI80F_001895 [Natronomonas sp.]|jgi:hypothetical protein
MGRRTGFAVGAVVAAVALLTVAAAPAAAHTNDAEADAQLSENGTLLLEWEFSEINGWLVVRADNNGEPGEPLGARRVDAETAFQTDTTVQIDKEAWGEQTGSREIWVNLHREEGGEGFDLEDDPLVTAFGNPAGSQLTVEKANRTAHVSAQDFGAQQTTNNTVTVRRVVMPENGYLAIHDSGAEIPGNAVDGDIGAAVGTTELSAGVHENVTVELDPGYVADGAESRIVQAVLYRGEESFDAASTERVMAGDATINTAFGVEFLRDGTPTPTPDESSVVNTPEPTDTSTESPTSDADGPGVGVLGALVVLLSVGVGRRRLG